MKKMTTSGKLLLVAAAMLVFAGCGPSYHARTVDIKDSPLVNPELLKKGSGDEALYRYVNPNADIKKYNKVLVEPVLVLKDGELSKDELENYQKLANNAYVYLVRELQKDYQVVQTPDPGTMRVQMAIIDADKSKPVRNTLSTFMPIGMGLSAVKYAATGKMSGVGEVTSQMKITDASTGELLGAALDRRVGGKELSTLWSTWANADAGLQYWAKRLAYVLCDYRGAGNCQKP